MITLEQTLTSLEVAEMVGKRHDNVMRDIKNIIKVIEKNNVLKSEGVEKYFIKGKYLDKKSEIRDLFRLTKIGCEIFGNRMTGDKGTEFAINYVNRFNEMEKSLKELDKPSYELEDPIARAKKWMEEQEQRMLLEAENKELKPKAEYAEQVLESNGSLNITQIAKEYEMSSVQLNSLLHKMKIQYKSGNQWVLYKKYVGQGLVDTETITYPKTDGTKGATLRTKWTQKGRKFIHEALKSADIIE